jgi:predicted ester cyclase
VADEIVAQDHALHDPVLPDLPTGPEGDKQGLRLYRGAFPGANLTIEDQIAEGDKVVTRWTGRGTHQGELMGVAASGNQVQITGISISRISEGKLAETWTNYDALGMMQQIGAVPKPAPSEEASPT